MLNLVDEQEKLAMADRHIADGERRISEQALLVEHLQAAGDSAESAERLLANLKETLGTWNVHRHEIIRSIERLEKP